MIGQTLGNYRITGPIGQGGMGMVYRGEHVMMGNPVAIKVLLPEFSHDKELVQRFFNEAQAATRIAHPGIVKVFDFGEHSDGSNYIIMEFLRGESLADRLVKCGRIPLGPGLRILQQCAGALEAAHRASIVHRDLKPDNIFLSPDPDITGGERVKLLDFGVAKLVGDLSAGHSNTRTGSLVGTPRFMSPEQCAGGTRPIDHRADLYALGCVGFAVLCGRPPFLYEGLGELLAAHMFQVPPSAMSLEATIPLGIDSLLMRLLAKEPAQRYASAAEVAQALDVAGQGLHHEPQRPSGPILTGSVPALNAVHLGNDAGSLAATLTGAPVSVYSSGVTAPARRRWPRALAALLICAGLGALIGMGIHSDADHDGVFNPVTSEQSDGRMADAAPPVREVHDEDASNRWVRIEPPPIGQAVVLGVSAATLRADSKAVGWRPERAVRAPSAPYAMHQHEVTWAEITPWLDEHLEMVVYRPAWLPDNSDVRASQPATGLPWITAQAYCASLGARLPTEAEWEYAARGAELRPYAWGDERLDQFRTHAYAGPKAALAPVMSKDQDRTPGTLESSLRDMMGNAQEWTADLWREDAPGSDESWVQKGGKTYRAVRGLPPDADPPRVLPREGAAYRNALCATASCIVDSEHLLDVVGVRCARDVRESRP